MEGLLSKGSSIYHRLVSLYTRRVDGSLVNCTNRLLEEHWSTFQEALQKECASSHRQISSRRLRLPFVTLDGSSDAIYLERPHASGSWISGIIVKPDGAGIFDSLDDFFMDLILRTTQEDATAPGTDALCEIVDDIEALDASIVDLFDASIRNVTPDDQWQQTGRDLFSQRVRHFTGQAKKIELALPAFPCKSSNPNKVGGKLPDRGEMIALTNLHQLVKDIEDLYAPGARLWVISDGHVFGDCIGVDDSMVDTYSTHLRQMNDSIAVAFLDNGRRRVCFQSLTEMLRLNGDDIKGQALAQYLELDPINHHIAQVQLNDDAELCRRLLMQGFKASTTQLRERIAAQDSATLALYRGFSRFMLEDLEQNRYTKHMSKSQRRKLSSKVAFEMIERNQAYSNLVEMVFPYHIRLSIHAHNNAGPKFGINLMGPQFRATTTLPPDGRDAESHDLLHVPTPWHGCVVEIAGHHHLYLSKVEQVRSAIQEERVLAAWVVPSIGEEPDHGRVSVYRGVRSPRTKVSNFSSDASAPLSAAYFSLIPTCMQYRI